MAVDALPLVVVAIVTSELGVLAGRRHDEAPPWTFIGGQVEPGESINEAAAREVDEETQCPVAIGEELGRRVHPATGRSMIYVTATPTHGTAVTVGDPTELAEVRWLTLGQVETLMPDIFQPVHHHLRIAIA